MNERYTKLDGTPVILDGNGAEIPFVQTYLNHEYQCLMNRDFHNMEEFMELLAPYFLNVNHEASCFINLDSNFNPINVMMTGMGDCCGSPVPISIALQGSLLSNAQGAIFVHNHPHMVGASKNIKPSTEDIMLTGQLIKAYDAIGLKLYDAVIIGWTEEDGKKTPCWYSMREHRKFNFPLSNQSYYKDRFMGWGLAKKSKNYYKSIRNEAVVTMEEHLDFEDPTHNRLSKKEYIQGLAESKKHPCAITVSENFNNAKDASEDLMKQLILLDQLSKMVKDKQQELNTLNTELNKVKK